MPTLKSDNFESQQEKVSKLDHKIACLTEEVQLIEMTLDLLNLKKPPD